MWLIALNGLGMIIISCIIIFKPGYFSFKTIEFAHKPWFHKFEILLRLIIGFIFIYFSEQTLHPVLFGYLGYLILAVGIGLMFLPEKLHRKFAVYWAGKVKWLKAPAVAGVFLGCFVIYSSVATPLGWI